MLCATGEQVAAVLRLRPAAAGRTFVIGELGRLLPDALLGFAGSPVADPASARARGMALVAAVQTVRSRALALPGDDLDDPYGQGPREFARAADRIETVVVPLAHALAG